MNEFTKNFFSESDRKIDWYGGVGLYKLDDMRLVKIRTSTPMTCYGDNRYVGYDIQIIHKLTGEIDRATFDFAHYLTFTHEPKYDHAIENNDNREFSLVRHHTTTNSKKDAKYDWYISRPATTKPLIDAMFQYIDSFK